MTTPKNADLYYCEGSSDKEYHAHLKQEGAGWVVSFQYGRRGTALQSGTKTQGPVPYEKADAIYDKLVKEKLAKGYSPGAAGTAFQATPKEQAFTGILPQLLNPISEADLLALLQDPAWALQVKFDGERRMIDQRPSFSPRGINRKGLEVALPQELALAAIALGNDALLDGELVGDVLFAFDLLRYKEIDLAKAPYEERYAKLAALIGANKPGRIRLAAMALTTSAKETLLEDVELRGLEGVVAKRLDATYTSGRPNSGGPMVKFKLVESATVEVIGANETKRSVMVQVFSASGTAVPLGNVTIPPNLDVPAAGALVEVRYLYAHTGGSLFQPVYLGERKDMDRSAATVEQLKFKPTGEPLAA